MEHPILDLAQNVPDYYFRYADQLLMALLPMMATVVIHAQGMGLIQRGLDWFVQRPEVGRRRRPHILLLVVTVAIMLATHLLEVGAWAAFFVFTGMLPDPDIAMYFSMSNFSTLGTSDVVLPGRWKGMAGLEAMTSMLMFGWSTAVLATVVLKVQGVATSKG